MNYIKNQLVAKSLKFLLLAICGLNAHIAAAEEPSYCLREVNEMQIVIRNNSDSKKQKMLDRSGWTWVNPPWDGDIYPLDYFLSPDGNKKVTVPELYWKSCSSLQKFFGGCEWARSRFSEATGVAFIRGYEFGLSLGKNEISYALHGSHTIELKSKSGKSVRYVKDIPKLNIALLRGENDEIIFFDGQIQSELAIKENNHQNSFKGTYRKLSSWISHDHTVDDRVFLQSGLGRLKKSEFLYEIIEGPNLKKFNLDNRIKHIYNLVKIPNSHHIFLFTDEGIYIEDSNKFSRVANIPENYRIWGMADIGLTSQNEIHFPIRHGDSYRYFLLSQQYHNMCDYGVNLGSEITITATAISNY